MPEGESYSLLPLGRAGEEGLEANRINFEALLPVEVKTALSQGRAISLSSARRRIEKANA